MLAPNGRSAEDFYRMKVASLSIPRVILDKGLDIKYTTTNIKTGIEVSVDSNKSALVSTTMKYADIWNECKKRAWFEGDGVPGIICKPLPQIGDWFERNHKYCAILDSEFDKIVEYFSRWLSMLVTDASIKDKDSNVGFPYFEKERRAEIVRSIIESPVVIKQLLNLKDSCTVTGYRVQDEKINKVRTTIILDKNDDGVYLPKIVEIDKTPSQYDYLLKVYSGGCSERYRVIQVLEALNTYLQVIGTLLHKTILSKPLFRFDPLEMPSKDVVSIDAKAQDTCSGPVYFKAFERALIESGYKLTAEVFRHVYNNPAFMQAVDGTYHMYQGTTCEYSDGFKHWGLPTGISLTSALNKLIHTYNLYVRPFGIDKSFEIFDHPGHRRNNADDNLLLKSESEMQIKSAEEVGYEITVEKEIEFNGFRVDIREGIARWCSRLTTFFRRLKPESSAGGNFKPQAWLGFLVGRAFHWQHLPDKDRNVVLDEMKFLDNMFETNFYDKVSLIENWAIDKPTSYITYLSLTKPDAAFWSEDVEKELEFTKIENVRKYLL